jgi:hypothetical protein
VKAMTAATSVPGYRCLETSAAHDVRRTSRRLRVVSGFLNKEWREAGVIPSGCRFVNTFSAESATRVFDWALTVALASPRKTKRKRPPDRIRGPQIIMGSALPFPLGSLTTQSSKPNRLESRLLEAGISADVC